MRTVQQEWLSYLHRADAACRNKLLTATAPRGIQTVLWFLGITICTLLASPVQAQTFGCQPALANEIVCENLKPGTPSSTWKISGTGDSSIQGFATDISVNRGQTVFFKIKTDATAYRLDIYRMGYYSGNGKLLNNKGRKLVFPRHVAVHVAVPQLTKT